MKNFCKLFSLSLFLLSSSVLADNSFDYYITRSCELNKNNSVKTQPENFNYSNNLISDIGSPMIAKGKIFILTGKIVDKNCVPISDAKINIWQADSYGVFNNPQDNSKATKKSVQDFFQITGTANSDNLGIFHFITLLPNYFNKKDGEIFLKVTTNEIGEFYKTIKINDTMLKNNDLYLLYPNETERFFSLPQYKFIWTLEAINNFINY